MVRGNGMVAARRLWGWLVLALIAVLAATGPSSAQTPTPFAFWQNDAGVVLRPLGGPVPNWDVTIGMGAAVIPLYEGSDHYRTVPSPASCTMAGMRPPSLSKSSSMELSSPLQEVAKTKSPLSASAPAG